MKLGEAGEAYFVDESSKEGDDESSSSCESLIEGGVLNELKRAKSTEPLRDKNRSDGNSTPPITITDTNKNVTMKSIDESIDEFVRIPHGKQPVQLSLSNRCEHGFDVLEKRFQLFN